MREVLVRLATLEDVPAIAQVCSDGWRDTYSGLHSLEYVEDVIARYYNPQRIAAEIGPKEGWDGWLVAQVDSEVIGASGGGATGETTWEIFVLYLNPVRRRQGAGRALLRAMTEQALTHGATEQWVSVTQENSKGLPFYEAMGFEISEAREGQSQRTGESVRTYRLSRRLNKGETAHA